MSAAPIDRVVLPVPALALQKTIVLSGFNIAFTKFDKQCKLLQMDVLSGLRTLEGKYTFDLIFMDPPYKDGSEKQVLTFLSQSSLVKPSAKIIVEAAKDTDFSYAIPLGYEITKEKIYKTNKHVFLKKNKA